MLDYPGAMDDAVHALNGEDAASYHEDEATYHVSEHRMSGSGLPTCFPSVSQLGRTVIKLRLRLFGQEQHWHLHMAVLTNRAAAAYPLNRAYRTTRTI